ncbi:CHAP domain-containing protein [Sandaracinus amylolyticus]|uniref:EGF-like domain-containing protein n=1 Tax=Sandaracinus amylolyticus TaxID=927083 RepID=A0A0F6W6J6_9BACT|nr:CHAP domain-containing protein [Sandaracinus amylolyticus]AKF08546.1 hypothetical protein DB32_005695 [Sandaracinus amylolyticus]
MTPRAALVLMLALLPSTARAQGPCAGVTCSLHGLCTSERDEAFCACDEGFDAVELECVRAHRRAPAWSPSSAVRAVEIALGEVDHDLASVGRARRGDPGALASHVRADALWCSDFVSWVYRAAGVPFTGGSRGGWLLPTNTSIRRWFDRRGAYVSRADREWSSFVPQPGDYVRISTPTWGHSAIVQRVDGETLHTIEGNAGGRVRLVRYARWRAQARIDGFGSLARAHTPRVVPAVVHR